MSDGFDFISNDLRANITPAKNSRALDTPFQPSLTRPALVTYTVDLNVSGVGPGDNEVAQATLKTGSANPPTTTRCAGSLQAIRSGLVSGTETTDVQVVLSALVPTGHWVEIDTFVSAAGTVTLSHEDEVVL